MSAEPGAGEGLELHPCPRCGKPFLERHTMRVHKGLGVCEDTGEEGG